MFDFSNPLFRDPNGSVYKIRISDSFLYEVQRAVSAALYKFVPDALSLEESPSNSNTSFPRQKGCLRQTVSYTHTHTHILTDGYIYTYRERKRERCSGCCGSLCTKSEALTVQAAEENQCFFWSVHFSCQVTASVLSYLRLPATVVKSHRQGLRWLQPPVPTRNKPAIHAFALQYHGLPWAC